MTLTIDLPAGIEERLRSVADSEGVPMEKFVLGLIEEKIGSGGVEGGELWRTLSTEEWLAAFQEWVESHKHIEAPVIPLEALRRENMYEDRL